MFFSSPSADINIMMIFLTIALIVSIAVYFFSKKLFLSIFVMSLLSNVILYIGIDYNLAKIYDILGIFNFSRDIFPYINIVLFLFLIITVVRSKYAKTND